MRRFGLRSQLAVMRNREIAKAPVDPYLGEEPVDWGYRFAAGEWPGVLQ